MAVFRKCEPRPKRHFVVTDPTLEALLGTVEFQPSTLEVLLLFVRYVGLAGCIIVEHHDKSIIGRQQLRAERAACGIGGYRPFN